ARGELAPEERRRVYADAEMSARGREGAQILDDGLQVAAHHMVVVLASRVFRHVSRAARRNRACDGDDRPREGKDRVEARALLFIALEIGHLSVKPLCEPL